MIKRKQGGHTSNSLVWRPGEYSLSETVVPNGYQGMSGTVRISISREGVVSIQSNPNVSGSGGVGNPNLIQLTVTNRKRGAGPLPSTGGSGTAMFFKVALGVISTAGGTAWQPLLASHEEEGIVMKKLILLLGLIWEVCKHGVTGFCRGKI